MEPEQIESMQTITTRNTTEFTDQEILGRILAAVIARKHDKRVVVPEDEFLGPNEMSITLIDGNWVVAVIGPEVG